MNSVNADDAVYILNYLDIESSDMKTKSLRKGEAVVIYSSGTVPYNTLAARYEPDNSAVACGQSGWYFPPPKDYPNADKICIGCRSSSLDCIYTFGGDLEFRSEWKCRHCGLIVSNHFRYSRM